MRLVQKGKAIKDCDENKGSVVLIAGKRGKYLSKLYYILHSEQCR